MRSTSKNHAIFMQYRILEAGRLSCSSRRFRGRDATDMTPCAQVLYMEWS